MTTDKDIVRLTPELFRELDLLARSLSGRVLRVVKHTSLKRAFARIPLMAYPVFIDKTITKGYGYKDEIGIIEVANQVDVNSFHQGQRPELDWKKIPRDRIYKFLVLHEIGHSLYPCNDFFALAKPECIIAGEILADRYAWNSLFPDTPIPRRSLTREEEIFRQNYLKTAREYYPIKPRSKIRPTPLDPDKYVPVDHVEQGIPWAV